MTCGHCGAEVAEGLFCTRCGAHQEEGQQADAGRHRLHRYAAHPGEHVGHPNVFSTLLPHSSHHRVHEFRWAFLLGVAVLFGLYATGLVGAALLAAAVLVPALYLLYLYEAEVYRKEPLRVLGLTFGGGLLLGAVTSIVVSRVGSPPVFLSISVDALVLVAVTVLLPLLQEVIKLAPALGLYRRFPQTVDGLVFGVASGLGFALAEAVVDYWPLLSVLPARVDPQNWIYPVLVVGVLTPLMQGSCTGVVAAAVWSMRHRGATPLEWAGIMVALIAHVAFTLVTAVLQADGVNWLVILGWQALVVALVVVYIRLLLHAALLEEARDMGLSNQYCGNCRREVMAAGFCPTCGGALAAAARREQAVAAAGS